MEERLSKRLLHKKEGHGKEKTSKELNEVLPKGYELDNGGFGIFYIYISEL